MEKKIEINDQPLKKNEITIKKNTNKTKRNKNTITTIVLVIFLVLSCSFISYFFVIKNKNEITIIVKPSINYSFGDNYLLPQGKDTNINDIDLNKRMYLPSTNIDIEENEIFSYECILKNNSNNIFNFEIQMTLENSSYFIVKYQINDEEPKIYNGEMLKNSLPKKGNTNLNFYYEILQEGQNVNIKSTTSLVVNKAKGV